MPIKISVVYNIICLFYFLFLYLSMEIYLYLFIYYFAARSYAAAI